jgi:uncharacterized repeat protein (TIGR03803 family)
MLRKISVRKRSAMLVLLVFGVLLGEARAQKESVLHSFCAQNNCADGEIPWVGVAFDQKGNLYGTTPDGGAYGGGVVFKLTPEGKETVLYSFCDLSGCTDGANPYAGVIFDQKGNLYGTTLYGGPHGYGVVFKITPEGKETVLHSFCPQGGYYCPDGAQPLAGLVLDRKGNLYGTTPEGGASKNCDYTPPYGCGIVFKLTPGGKEIVLHSFCAQSNCPDGLVPTAGLISDQNGYLYGTTQGGGAYGGGTVFKITPEGKYTVLYSFCAQTNCVDGANPSAGLVFDQKGKLYGTTSQGGVSNGCPGYTGCGVVFELTTKGKETVLYSFCARDNCLDGAGPYAGLVLDPKGNLYRTTEGGGGIESRGNNGGGIVPKGYSGGGVVFKVTAKGKETVLRTFCEKNCTDGEYPDAGLVFDRNGNLYGTTFGGGANAQGVVFKLTP